MPKGVRKARNPQSEDMALDDIKRLLMVLMFKNGVSKSEIAAALAIDPSAVSRMVDWSKVKDPQ